MAGADTLYEHLASKTFPSLLADRVREVPDRVALREKDLGIYQEVTWKEYGEHVENFCLGLVELGLERGDRIAIMGNPCPEWVYADLSVQSAGGISYGIFSTSAAAEVKHLMGNGGAKFFVAGDQEHVDKLLAVIDQLPLLRKIIVIDTRAMFMYDDPRLISFVKVEEMGQQRKAAEPHLFQELVTRVKPDDVATIIYTSGTTGAPKGVMLSHRNILSGWSGLLSAFPEVRKPQRVVSLLELAHMMERANSAYLPLMADFVPHFSDSAEAVQETLFEVSPTYVSAPPRFWQKWAAQALSEMEDSTWLKKGTYRFAMAIGRRYVQRRWNGKTSMPWELLYRIAYWLSFRHIADRYGFARVRHCNTGGGPVTAESIALWQIWGVPLREGFGSTEAGGLALLQLEAIPRPGNAGKPLATYEMKVTEEGEILLGGPPIFAGYWQDEEATERIKKDGWIHTGDLVKVVDGGNIKIVDRLKDVLTTSGGKTMSPSEIEKALKSSPFISEAVVFGHARKYPVALIEINFDTVSEWARSHGVIYGSFTSLSQHPQVYGLIQKEVEKANANLARVEQPKKFAIIPKELDPEEDGEPITATRKVQRGLFYQRFKQLVESMYTAEEEERITAEIGMLESEMGSGSERII